MASAVICSATQSDLRRISIRLEDDARRRCARYAEGAMARLRTDPRQVLSVVRRHLGLVDVVVAVALTAGALDMLSHLQYRGSVVLAVISCVSCTAAVAFRRVAPQAAMMQAVTSVAVYQSVTSDPQGAFVSAALVLAAYMLVVRCSARAVMSEERSSSATPLPSSRSCSTSRNSLSRLGSQEPG